MATPPTNIPTGPPRRRIDASLLKSIASALEVVQNARLQYQRSVALAELGDIDLPDTAPTPEDAHRLQIIGPLYLSYELEQAGLLRTAELVAGLFASGAIVQPLGPTAQLIAEYWRTRHQRMNEAERQQILSHIFTPQEFYPLMYSFCDALVQRSVYPVEPVDIYRQTKLQHAAEQLGATLALSGGGMVSYAADEILQTLTQALRFLRDRLLQTAFGVHDLWSLVDVVGQARGQGGQTGRHRADLGRAGTIVLNWLSTGIGTRFAFNPASADDQKVMTAAEDWILTYQTLTSLLSSSSGQASQSALPVAQFDTRLMQAS